MERFDPMCVGKIKYPTKAAALRRIDAQMGRHHQVQCNSWHGRQMQSYRCPRCYTWHVGGSHPKMRESERTMELDDGVLAMLPTGVRVKLLGRA